MTAWGYGRGLAQHLAATGETVYEINARWTALRRRSAHKPGKTDQLDAQAIALFVRQEGGRKRKDRGGCSYDRGGLADPSKGMAHPSCADHA
jgi:hypothetical protein